MMLIGTDVPMHCICGREAAIVKSRYGYFVTSPDPERCIANIRTAYFKKAPDAVMIWNSRVLRYRVVNGKGGQT